MIPLIELGQRSAGGYASGAYRCEGQDGRFYWVKSPRQAGAHAVVAEWIGFHLARQMNLPVQEGTIVEVPRVLLEAQPNYPLGSGPAFGSLELAFASEMTYQSAQALPEMLKAQILAFDHWIRNMDRTLGPGGGNPNLLTAKGVPVALIDHGNAFDSEYNTSYPTHNHVFATSHEWWIDQEHRVEWNAQANQALETLTVAWDAIPEEWHESPLGDSSHDLTLEVLRDVLHGTLSSTSATSPFWAPLTSS